MLGRVGAVAALLMMLAVLLACAEDTRYRVLSFFFDGVPPPGQEQEAAPAGKPQAQQVQTGSVAVSRHEPYQKRLCGACHEPGSNTLIAPVPGLCLGCHKIDLRTPRYIHGPLATGFCALCHSPHTSPNPKLLIAKMPDLCLYCHNQEGIPQDEAHQSPSSPCGDCHATHAGNKFFLRPDRYPDAGERQ